MLRLLRCCVLPADRIPMRLPKRHPPPAGPVLVISESTESSQQSSTIAGITPTTEMKGSGTASGPGGTGSTAPNKSHEAGTTKPTSPVVPDKPAQTPQTVVPRVRQPLARLLSATTDKPQTSQHLTPHHQRCGDHDDGRGEIPLGLSVRYSGDDAGMPGRDRSCGEKHSCRLGVG